MKKVVELKARLQDLEAQCRNQKVEKEELSHKLVHARAEADKIVARLQAQANAYISDLRHAFAQTMAAKEDAWDHDRRLMHEKLAQMSSRLQKLRAPGGDNDDSDSEAHDVLSNGQRRISISRQMWRHEVLNTIAPPGVPNSEIAAALEARHKSSGKINQEESGTSSSETEDEKEYLDPESENGIQTCDTIDGSDVAEGARTLDIGNGFGAGFTARKHSKKSDKEGDGNAEDKIGAVNNTDLQLTRTEQNSKLDVEDKQIKSLSKLSSPKDIRVEELIRENRALQNAFRLFHASCENRTRKLNDVISQVQHDLFEAKREIANKDHTIQHLRDSLEEITRLQQLSNTESSPNSKTPNFEAKQDINDVVSQVQHDRFEAKREIANKDHAIQHLRDSLEEITGLQRLSNTESSPNSKTPNFEAKQEIEREKDISKVKNGGNAEESDLTVPLDGYESKPQIDISEDAMLEKLRVLFGPDPLSKASSIHVGEETHGANADIQDSEISLMSSDHFSKTHDAREGEGGEGEGEDDEEDRAAIQVMRLISTLPPAIQKDIPEDVIRQTRGKSL